MTGMIGFEDVTLSWQGKDYIVPANKQMMLIAKIEDALAGDSGQQAFTILFRKGGVPHSRLAMAYGAALRYAGAGVTDEEIYLSIHQDIADESRQQVAAKFSMMTMGLLALISPPAARRIAKATESPEAKNP